MSCDLDVASPDSELVRIGRYPDPWNWTDWSYAGADGTFGNRWDDPQSDYRVLYVCSQRLGAFMETLGRFPADPQVESGLAEIELEDGEMDHALPPGHVNLEEWVRGRLIGRALVGGDFAAVGRSRSLGYLHQAMMEVLPKYGLDELDGAAIRLTAPRELTQRISRLVYECSDDRGRRQFDGIHYLSRYGDEFANWAIFEPADVRPIESAPISPADSDLREAGERLGLTFV